ncbi:MAG: DNA gyrase inhibitor YacG [Spiribacter sp.]|nr:DNA gyrase inhibitor YacG [Spiribacter sp.]MDR9454718.1 DNA gyrase inhibitor YacG [Spiribacter sp.]
MSPSHLSAASSKSKPTVPCPQCGTTVTWSEAAPERPFCSRRCRLIDLGEWFEEAHHIPGEPAELPEEDSD